MEKKTSLIMTLPIWEAGTWINFLTLIINKKISGEELRNMIFAFPTQTYMLVSTLIPLMQKAD